MKKILILIFIIVISLNYSFATEQISDLLIIENDTICLQTFPLEDLNFKIRPFKYGDYDFPHTACWRGYQAIWKIIDNKLFLIEINRVDSINERLDLEKYFKRNDYEPEIINGLIYANWFSADLEKYPGLYVNKNCIYKSYNPKESKTIMKFDKGVLTENKKTKR